MSVHDNKSPRNDGPKKEFFVTFWDDIKDIYLNSCRTTNLKKELSTSQGQAIIKLTEKKDKDKAVASRLHLISPHQMAYVENRFVGESSRLIADIIEITVIFNKEGYRKSLRFIRSYFCHFCIEKNGFSNNFVSWIEALISKIWTSLSGTFNCYF